MTDLLAPVPDREHRKLYRQVENIARRVAASALLLRPTSNMIAEVYIAGLYHGSILGEREPKATPRVVDRIDIKPDRRRRVAP